MRVGFLGTTHLAQTMMRASEIRGCEVVSLEEANDRWDRDFGVDLIVVGQDVEDHERLSLVNEYMTDLANPQQTIPVVLLSQVPVGYTRGWSNRIPLLYYQVDTIIMSQALQRATLPERIIIGSSGHGIHAKYREYLEAFRCPVLEISYESAELAKMLINCHLSWQVDFANKMSALANNVGADWSDVAAALKTDVRIGPYAYLRPGEINEHLARDVRTVEKMLCR